MYYTNSAGVRLKSVLYYPANYDASKKYPMVVEIYELQSSLLHNYVNPTERNQDGINVANLTSKGYFVLRPDIVYGKGNPGVSAADCTIAATNEVVRREMVDSSRIGLAGHSFGGYEVNFIITQTSLFAAAVSGCGIADVPAHYLSIGWNLGKPEIFRFENQQWRMGKSLFDDWDGYQRNSPVRHAAKITTPLLLWTGEDDRQVHYHQSIAFYLALKRLNKKQILLVYPKEEHNMEQPKNQRHLTVHIEDWFDYFLKGDRSKEWISRGIN